MTTTSSAVDGTVDDDAVVCLTVTYQVATGQPVRTFTTAPMPRHAGEMIMASLRREHAQEIADGTYTVTIENAPDE